MQVEPGPCRRNQGACCRCSVNLQISQLLLAFTHATPQRSSRQNRWIDLWLEGWILTEVCNLSWLRYAMVAGILVLSCIACIWCIFICAPMHVTDQQSNPNQESRDNALPNAFWHTLWGFRSRPCPRASALKQPEANIFVSEQVPYIWRVLKKIHRYKPPATGTVRPHTCSFRVRPEGWQ